MAIHKFSFPTLIYFGPGARKEMRAYLKANGVRRPIIVTDKGVADLSFCKDIQKDLSQDGLETGLFSGVWGNPVESQVTAGVKAYKDHRSDSIVGLGGGAALDVAKAIALMVNHPGNLFDYEDDMPGARPIDKDIPFWIAVPTTAGTGSEVGRSTVISDDKTHIKKIMFSPRLMAKAVFADPELTVELPPKVTAATGMDALTHCVESYLAKGYHPICDGVALEGIRLAAKSLVKAVKNPKDIEARSDMLLSSMMGAIAFQKGLGLTHSCAHALSTIVDMHHGFANGLMIDHALPHNIPAVPERFKTMAVTIGLKDTSPEGFIQWLKDLKAQVGIPSKMTDAGVKKENLTALVDVAIKDACHPYGPRACAKSDFERIFSTAL